MTHISRDMCVGMLSLLYILRSIYIFKYFNIFIFILITALVLRKFCCFVIGYLSSVSHCDWLWCHHQLQGGRSFEESPEISCQSMRWVNIVWNKTDMIDSATEPFSIVISDRCVCVFTCLRSLTPFITVIRNVWNCLETLRTEVREFVYLW